jgi:hypothetical protein
MKKYFIILIIIILLLGFILFYINNTNKKNTISHYNDYQYNDSYKSFREKCRIVTFFTGNLCEEWRNLLATVKKLNLEDIFVVFVLDQDALQCATNENNKSSSQFSIRKDLITKDLQRSADFGTKGFRDIVAKKFLAISKILEENYITFYVDSDIVFLKNPIEDYFKLPPKELYIQSDKTDFNLSGFGHFCTGVIVVLPTKKMIDIFKKAQYECINKKVGTMDDQGVMNEYINNNIIDNNEVGTLDPYDYPNGARYFDESNRKKINNPVLIHNNYIVGTEAKIKRFKEHNLWFI